MKIVILEPREHEEIHYKKVTDQSFVGYMTNETCKFMAVKYDGVIFPIGKSNYLDNNKATFVDMQHILKKAYKAYYFESFDELINWLSE